MFLGLLLTGESKPFAEQLANRLGGNVGNEEASLRLRAFLDKVALKPGDDADTVRSRSRNLSKNSAKLHVMTQHDAWCLSLSSLIRFQRELQVMMKSLQAPVGVVLLDDVYLTKEWPVRELRRIMELLTDGKVRVLPVMYNMTYRDLGDLMKRLSDTDSSASKGASRDDAAMLEKLKRITMIHSNTSDVVRTFVTSVTSVQPGLPLPVGSGVNQSVLSAQLSLLSCYGSAANQREQPVMCRVHFWRPSPLPSYGVSLRPARSSRTRSAASTRPFLSPTCTMPSSICAMRATSEASAAGT